MRPLVVIRVVGLFLILFSLTLAPPAAIAYFSDDGELWHFVQSILLLAAPGLLLWIPTRRHKGNLRNREAFLVVSLFWIMLGMLGSVPLILGAHLGPTDAVFEAVSGFTTTGATTMVGIDRLPHSILMYRQQLQWFGGLGVIVLAVAILPMLGVGGMQLYRAETPGPMKDEKVTPRIAHTARYLWTIYLSLTVACTIGYWLAGMSLFDAVAHSLSTISTGGFSTHDASIGYFDNPAVESIAIVFMLIGGISFSIHFLAMRGSNLSVYWSDTQSRAFIITTFFLVFSTAAVLYLGHRYTASADALRYAAFQVVSIITSTGYSTDNFSVWPLGLPLLLIFSSFVGGCAGSTAGGMKIIRFIVLGKIGWRETVRLVHPAMFRHIKIGGVVLPPRVLDAVWGFFSIYVIVFVLLLLLVMATGVDHVTAFGAVSTCLNNLGPGLGDVAVTFQDINPAAKWFCIVAMLLGRLEIFTIAVLFMPEYWKK